MLGAIIGDIVGSVHEHSGTKTKEFPLFGERCRFTDDTVCTIAIAACLMNDGDFGDYLSHFTLRYGTRGFGAMFLRWAKQWERRPYGSYGNGSAMRVSPVGQLADDEAATLRLAEASAAVSHNHPEGIRGAQAVAWTIWALRQGRSPEDVRAGVERRFAYDLRPTVDQFREVCVFDPTCQGTVPPALVCAFEAVDFEDAVRNAVSLGGDADTLACIAGSVAETIFEIPDEIARTALDHLNDEFREILTLFNQFKLTGRITG